MAKSSFAASDDRVSMSRPPSDQFLRQPCEPVALPNALRFNCALVQERVHQGEPTCLQVRVLQSEPACQLQTLVIPRVPLLYFLLCRIVKRADRRVNQQHGRLTRTECRCADRREHLSKATVRGRTACSSGACRGLDPTPSRSWCSVALTGATISAAADGKRSEAALCSYMTSDSPPVIRCSGRTGRPRRALGHAQELHVQLSVAHLSAVA
jgi:hypothetical protein